MSKDSYFPDPETYPYHRYVAAVRKSPPEHAPPDWPATIERTVYQKRLEETPDGRRYFVWEELNER